MSQLQTQEKDGVLVIRLRNRKLFDERAIQEAGHEFYEIADHTDAKSIIVNLQGVDFVSVAMLQKWIVTDQKVKRRGARWVFCNVCPNMLELLAMTRLNQFFTIVPDEQDALALLGGGNKPD